MKAHMEAHGMSTEDAKQKHRAYVGGMFDEIGELQFDFLKDQGLQEHHCLLDVACGSLRLGHHAIKYLDKARYIGFDHNAWLIEEGIKKELGINWLIQKAPLFIVNDTFNLGEINGNPTYAMCHSLFTHLTKDDIIKCLTSLNRFRWTMVFATFNVGDRAAIRRTRTTTTPSTITSIR